MLVSPHHSPLGVLTSGGLDSCILVAHLVEEGHRVQPFYIRSDTVWESVELAAARRFLAAVAHERLQPLVLLNMPVADVYADHWSISGKNTPDADSADEAVYLPGRNALLLVKAAIWCQLHDVRRLAWAPLGTSPFLDATETFAQRFQEALNLGAPTELEILLPFAQFDKKQVMNCGKAYPLGLTFSCISPVNGEHCGRCNKCAERRAAFHLVHLPDPTKYAHADWNTDLQ